MVWSYARAQGIRSAIATESNRIVGRVLRRVLLCSVSGHRLLSIVIGRTNRQIASDAT